MHKNYHTAVFIGRLQPMHRAHEYIIREALRHANEVIVVLGSSFAARSMRNPFTFEERKAMIKAVFPEPTVKVVPVSDYPYDDNKWVAAVQSVVMSSMAYTPDPIRIALIGHKKDETSYYLNLFKSWSSIDVPAVMFKGVSATDIRKHMFATLPIRLDVDAPELSGATSAVIIEAFKRNHQEFIDLAADQKKVDSYHRLWATVPYPPTFVTGDAILTQSGHVLLVRRGDYPFKNKWALPGGYLNQQERILDGVIRELREETRVKVPEKVLRGSVKASHVFDHPARDPRGRTITHAYHIDLGFPDETLPKVKGSDDAAEAKWFAFSELRQDMFAFDHFHVLNKFLNLQ